MNESLRVALVGAGGIGAAYAGVFDRIPDARLSAVCDLDPAAGVPMAKAAGAAFADDYRAIAGVDAVIVATPPSTHPEIALYFLRAGIPVLCEKPLAISIPAARGMVEESRRTGTILTMASKFRYVPDITAAREIIASGTIGEIILYENTFASRVDMTHRWNSVSAISGGGVLIDNGTHSLDIARYLLGPIEQVLAVEGKRIQTVDVEDTVSIFFTTVHGVTGTIDLSWSVNKERDSFIEIYGSGGSIRVGWRQSAYRLSNGWVQFGNGYDKLEAMTAQVNNFLGAVRGTESLLIQAEDGIASVAVVEAAYASLNSPRWIAVQTGSDHDRVDHVTIHATALVEAGVDIGPGSSVWDNVHIRGPATIGSDCIIGEKTYIAYGVTIGDRVKVNAFVYICTGVTIEDGVMLSAGTIFTNDRYPRAASSDLKALRASGPDEATLATTVREGATIGAGATIGPGIEIGRFAMVGMGAVVTRSVPAFALVVGTPARRIGWVCRCGEPLPEEVEASCGCGLRYVVSDGAVRET